MPGAPTSVTAVAGNGEATISFTAPVSNGGATITSYTVTSNVGGHTATGGSSPITVTGLTNGTTYTFTVTATNAVGTSVASSTSNSVVPSGAPGAPTSVTAVAGNGQAIISFTPPVSNGGSAIISYTVTSNVGGHTATGGSSPITVTGLTNGTTYTFTVTATNLYGTGPASGTSNSVVPATVPGAPTSVTAVAGNGEATVTFTPPVSNGGATITSYTVTSDIGGFTATGGNSPITITGLTNGVAYTFTVTATNSVGTSAASSASNSITPATVPDAPTNLAGTIGDTEVSLTWSAPAFNGGSTITSYTVTSNIGGHSATVAGTSATVTGLTNGVTYTFTVTATNAIGTSTASGTSNSVTPASVPGAPTNLAAVISDSSVDLSWSAPVSNGGSVLTDYVVQYKLTTGGTWAVFSDGVSTTPSTTVTGLSNDNSYDFRVFAKNAVGTGAASGEVSATPAPPAQVIIQSFSDLTVPSIATAVRITNEGGTAYEYQYTWCVTDSDLNVCGGGDDVFSASAAKLIQPLENFDTTLNSTVPLVGNYWFHLDVQFGSESSQSTQSFTAVADGTPPSGGGGGGGSSGGGGGGTSSRAHVDGTLIQDGNTFYLIKDSSRVGFRDPEEYKSYGYNFTQAVPASTYDLALPMTSIGRAMEGTLVLDSADGRTVYMIGANSTKRGFVSSKVFTALGYSFANLPRINLSDYPTGSPIGSSVLAHPDGSLVKEGITIWWIRSGQKVGFESMTVFNTYGFSLSRVVKANAADMSLPEGPVVKLRDGTLVMDQSTYFIISRAKKLAFTSEHQMTSLGYRIANVIFTNLMGYEYGGLVR